MEAVVTEAVGRDRALSQTDEQTEAVKVTETLTVTSVDGERLRYPLRRKLFSSDRIVMHDVITRLS